MRLGRVNYRTYSIVNTAILLPLIRMPLIVAKLASPCPKGVGHWIGMRGAVVLSQWSLLTWLRAMEAVACAEVVEHAGIYVWQTEQSSDGFLLIGYLNPDLLVLQLTTSSFFIISLVVLIYNNYIYNIAGLAGLAGLWPSRPPFMQTLGRTRLKLGFLEPQSLGLG